MSRVSQQFASYKDASITPVNPPPIRGLGSSAGFDFELQDRGGVGHDGLMKARDQLLDMAARDPDLAQVRANGLDDTPTFRIDVDREKASVLGVSLTDVDQAFSIAWGSRFVNNFLDTDSRIKRVYVQADAPFRMNPEDLGLLYVRNATGEMVPFSSFAKGTWTYGAPQLQRYNGVSAMEIIGQAAPGGSTGQAMLAMERLASELPTGIGFEWTGISLQQQQAGSQAPFFYALSIIVVFLSLAALYESWSIPLSVILVVPIGVLGALGAATLFGMSNGVYFQVALLTTIGLSAKNAILIVEFARELHEQGQTALEAALEAAKMRLRPIVMTSMAFVLGVLAARARVRRGIREPERDRRGRDRRHADRHLPRPAAGADVLRGDQPTARPLEARADWCIAAGMRSTVQDLRPPLPAFPATQTGLRQLSPTHSARACGASWSTHAGIIAWHQPTQRAHFTQDPRRARVSVARADLAAFRAA